MSEHAAGPLKTGHVLVHLGGDSRYATPTEIALLQRPGSELSDVTGSGGAPENTAVTIDPTLQRAGIDVPSTVTRSGNELDHSHSSKTAQYSTLQFSHRPQGRTLSSGHMRNAIRSARSEHARYADHDPAERNLPERIKLAVAKRLGQVATQRKWEGWENFQATVDALIVGARDALYDGHPRVGKVLHATDKVIGVADRVTGAFGSTAIELLRHPERTSRAAIVWLAGLTRYGFQDVRAAAKGAHEGVRVARLERVRGSATGQTPASPKTAGNNNR